MTAQSVEVIIADEIVARLTPEINAIIGRLDALTAVQLDINTQVRDMKTAIEQAVAECPCDEAPPVDSPPAPEPSPAPAPEPGPVPVPVPVPVDPPGSVRWRGALWTISAARQILRDGAIIPETAKTSGVQIIYKTPDDLLEQQNLAGEIYRWTGAPDWERIYPQPQLSIAANGTIPRPSA